MSSKHYLPRPHYPAYHIPEFLSGPAYVLSGSVVPDLYACALSTEYINLEDVYTTGLCANQKLGLTLTHDSR